ncbi:hypothetical protein N9L87_02120 [Rhodobacteraceae bacterium]|nr:hypothetical protein [Paracoccaceae bacterium]
MLKENDYEAALPFCLAEQDNERLAFIHLRLRDCKKSEQYFLLSDDSPKTNFNRALIHLFPEHCSTKIVSPVDGKALMEKAISEGLLSGHYILGRFFERQNKMILAKSHYISATKLGSNKIEEAVNAILSITPFTLKDSAELALNKNIGKELKCRLADRMARYNPKGIAAEFLLPLSQKRQVKEFMSGLCKKQDAFFLGLSYEFGIGNKEDFREAYRLYIIAGAAGHSEAYKARKRIRPNLSTKQVSSAACLADFGLNPNFFQKWKCSL